MVNNMINLDRERLKEEFKALLCVHTECMLIDFDEESFCESAVMIVERERAKMIGIVTPGEMKTIESMRAFHSDEGLVWTDDSNEGAD